MAPVHIHRLLFVERDNAVTGKTHDLVPGPEVFRGERGVSRKEREEAERGSEEELTICCA